jgi:hypothetical protein
LTQYQIAGNDPMECEKCIDEMDDDDDEQIKKSVKIAEMEEDIEAFEQRQTG